MVITLDDDRLATIVGIAALMFAAGVISSNLLMFDAPMADASIAEAQAWYVDNRASASFANAAVAVNFPAIIVLASGLYLLAEDHEQARFWTLIGALGTVALVATFAIVSASNIGLVSLADSNELAAFGALWHLHNAAFGINLTALGTAFFGFALGAYYSGLTARWMGMVGVVGAGLLLVTGLFNTWVAEGSMIVVIGFVGFILWVVWLVVLGFGLITRGTSISPS